MQQHTASLMHVKERPFSFKILYACFSPIVSLSVGTRTLLMLSSVLAGVGWWFYEQEAGDKTGQLGRNNLKTG